LRARRQRPSRRRDGYFARGSFVSGLKQSIVRGGLESLYFSGAHVALRPFVGGVGAILALRHVRPPRPDRFQPNRALEVTPQFFTGLVQRLRRSRLDLISLDEMHGRMVEGDFKRRFVCLTFDDGYRDLREWAYPVLKEEGVPFAIYVPTSFPDRLGELWWLVLEAVIARNNRLGLIIGGCDRAFDCGTVAEKQTLYDELYWWLRGRATEREMRGIVRSLAAYYHVDVPALCNELCMSWSELAELASDPLVTIGAHTVSHPVLSRLSHDAARSEMELSRSIVEAALAVRPAHLSYPYGDRTAAGNREFAIAAEIGFKTAVTARPGVLFARHKRSMTSLPRISLHGDYQQVRYALVLLSGAAAMLWKDFRQANAA
jgi:peptidoglycan/xylan/chitin deacetylase (PgdA/CDA1 family)